MRYLIDFLNSAEQSQIDAYLQTYSCTVIKQWNNFDKVYLVETDQTPGADPIVELVEQENHLALKPQAEIVIDQQHGCHTNSNYPDLVINTGDQKDWWKNYSYAQPNFESETLTIKRLGEGIDVYVMDSGIQADHPDFVGVDIVNLYSVTGSDFSDTNGHGTAIASLISGRTCGITDATIKVVKIFDVNHQTLQSEFLSALDAIIEDHEDNTFAIINASWSIPKNQWIENKLRICVQEGLFLVCAAGNNGTPIADVTPASMPEAITVGSYNQNLEPSNFSNYTGLISTTTDTVNHGALDGWAPGEEIWHAGINSAYGYSSGTSLACGIASAVAAANLSWRIEADGTRTWLWKNLIVQSLSNGFNLDYNTLLFSRDGILDLTNPKYADSRNTIATLWDSCLRTQVNTPDELPIKLWEGEEKTAFLFDIQSIKKIEPIDPLPDWAQYTKDGRIHFRVPLDAGPQNGEYYVNKRIRYNRTDITDEVEECVLDIYIFAADMDLTTIPEDDPVIPITLLASCLDTALGCRSGTAFQCFSFCNLFGGCCAGYKSAFQRCRCDPGF
jgi:hypothetical protein